MYTLGYPAVGKRTVGQQLADLLDGVLIDNQLIHHPVLALFRWDGKSPLPAEIWERTDPIRQTVLKAIEDLAPRSNSYVFTNCQEAGDWAAAQFDSVRSLAHRRGSLFLAVMLTCDVDEQVRRIDTPDRIALMKGSDPEGYRWHRQHVTLFQPPPKTSCTSTRQAPRPLRLRRRSMNHSSHGACELRVARHWRKRRGRPCRGEDDNSDGC